MNRSYTENRSFSSNSGIYDAFYNEVTRPCTKLQKMLFRMAELLRSLVKTLSSATVRRIAKAVVVTGSLLGILGAAGAMELGKISLFGGSVLCVLFVAVEFFCLRGKKRSTAVLHTANQN